MFSFFNSKKRVTAQMSNLANAGKVITCISLIERLANNKGNHQFGSSTDNFALYASAGVNQIFGEEVSELHRELDLDGIGDYVNNWFNSNKNILELVIQSLRTLHTINYATSGNLSSKGIETLELYGSKFPGAPNPDILNALVNREIEKLSPEYQATIRDKFHLTW